MEIYPITHKERKCKDLRNTMIAKREWKYEQLAAEKIREESRGNQPEIGG